MDVAGAEPGESARLAISSTRPELAAEKVSGLRSQRPGGVSEPCMPCILSAHFVRHVPPLISAAFQFVALGARAAKAAV
jgi:hypothetical protein